MSDKKIKSKEEMLFDLGYDILPNGKVVDPNGEVIETIVLDDREKFKIRHNGKSYIFSVHRVQGFKKFGDKIHQEGIVVVNKNKNILDNKISNIKICTRSERMMEIPEEMRLSSAINASSHLIKYDKEKVIEYYYNNNQSYKNTMHEFNIRSKSTLHNILKHNK